jgi:L-asparagine permease
MSRQQVPYGGVLLTCAVYVFGVLLNVAVPQRAFDIATAVASLGVLVTWATILICQMRLRATTSRPSFRMPGSPVTNWIPLGILALVVVLMPFAGVDQAVAFACIPGLVVVLVVGWRRVRVRASQPSSPRG